MYVEMQPVAERPGRRGSESPGPNFAELYRNLEPAPEPAPAIAPGVPRSRPRVASLGRGRVYENWAMMYENVIIVDGGAAAPALAAPAVGAVGAVQDANGHAVKQPPIRELG